MRSALVRRPHHHEAAVEPRYGAADEQEVVSIVHPDDGQVTDGDALVAVLPGHADALLRPAATPVARIGRNRTALPGAFLDPVTVPQAAEIVPLDRARIPAALGGADHVH